jgi:hypothetical protein
MRTAWSQSNGENYYIVNRQKFLTQFDQRKVSAQNYLSQRYDAAMAQSVCANAREAFERLLPGLPFIGGDRHPGTKWLVLAAHWVAFKRSMQKRGYPAAATARMMYELYIVELDQIAAEQMTQRGQYRFSQKYLDGMRQWAQKSKEGSGDWVADFIPGDGNSFDFGIDYHYCPCWEYFKSQNAADIAPYFCLVDFPEHQRMGTGLVRHKTLAQGDELCDFRYKQGRAVAQNWSTEIAKLR